jgi:hypothetical protein
MVMPTIPTIEPCPVADDFVSGLAAVQALGPCVRLVFYVDEALPEGGGEPVHVVRRKLVIPRGQVMAILADTLAFLSVGNDLAGGRAVRH